MNNARVILALLLLMSCEPSMKSVVGPEAGKNEYVNPIIIIPYLKPAAEPFSTKLKDNLEILFKADHRKVEIFVVEQKPEELTLNATSDMGERINETIRSDKKDLMIVFRTKTINFFRGDLQSLTYIIAAKDIKTRKEIWKAEFSRENLLGPAEFGKKTAAAVYKQLKADKVL